MSNPLLVSFVDPLRRTIRSSGSPETVRLCWSPSTRPNRMHDDQTISAGAQRPSSASSTQRTRRLRTLYLSGIMAVQTTFLRPLIDREPRRADRRDDAADEADQQRDGQAHQGRGPGDVEERQEARRCTCATSTTSQSSLQPSEPSTPPEAGDEHRLGQDEDEDERACRSRSP